MYIRPRLLLIFSTLLFFTGVSFSQTTSGDLVGTVKDATGSVVPGAAIIVTAESTGVSNKTVSGQTGEFRVSNLLPDKYDISVEANGFQHTTLRGVGVDLNKTSTAPITLAVGSSQSVEVSADAGVVLDTTSTNLSQTFSNVELGSLPTASVGYGVLNMALLSPGVASSGGLGIGVGPSVGGQRPRNNNFTIEGIDNNNKAVTGPLVYVPAEAVGNFTLITNQFSPEFGHSSGGQFNTNIVSGSNAFHGQAYEYTENRDLNAASGTAGGKIPNPRFDYNRYGGQLGGPILKDKLFFFGSFERQTTGQTDTYYLCTPTAAGIATLGSLPNSGFSSTNLAQYQKYTPTANYLGGAQVTDANDNACFNSTGPQVLTVTDATGKATDIPLGNYLVSAPNFTNFDALTTGFDYTISSKDSFRGRYIYNTQGSEDTSASLPIFFTTQPYRFHLIAFSEYHTFSPNLTNEFRVGFNRYANTLTAGNFTYPGLDAFPNLTIFDQGGINYGPDGNAPQFTIQNLYQATENISWVKGKHNIKLGVDGRKYISPQGFTQRARGDYQWNFLDEFLHDLAPTSFGERSAGNHTYYGDQSAVYGYGNDTWRVTPKVTINVGLRYEFTSVPSGERAQSLNAIASVPGLIDFHTPQPTYTSFAPRFGINWAPDDKTSVRAGFGIAQDVLFDNLGTLSFPPQYSTTQDVGSVGYPNFGDPNFLANGGLKAGSGSGTAVFDAPTARAKTSAYLPDQITPYAETYTLTVQRTISGTLTAEVGYVGTRGIHLPTQIQYNITPRVTAANKLPTYLADGTTILASGGANATNLADIQALSNILPQFKAAGFTSKITSYQPYSSSNYNGLIANLQGRLKNGLYLDASYTWSKTMDNATDEVFATVLTPRRPQNSQDLNADYSRSALDRTHRLTLAAIYDLPYFKNRGYLLRNLIGNWTIAPVYTYESPEYATALSGVNSNLNGDSGSAIDRPLINVNGIKDAGSGVTAIKNGANTIGYKAISNAYYVQAGAGTLPTASRNTLPIRPIDNFDLTASKTINFFDHYSVQFGAEAFNVLNHAQYIPGTIDNVNGPSFTSSYNFQTVTKSSFNHPEQIFGNNPRVLQLSGKFSF